MDDFSISLNDIKKDLGKNDGTKKLNDFDFISNDLEEVSTPKQKIPSNTPQPRYQEDEHFDLSLNNALNLDSIPKNGAINHHNSVEPQEEKSAKNEPKEEITKEKKPDTSPDISFVHGLYSTSNFQIPKKINVLFTFFVSLIILLIVWGNFATIDELTRGEGKVIPSSKIQKVQYLDGGLIAEILVKEGEHVLINQPLLKIDKTRVMASFEETQENIYSLEAKKTRLELELNAKYNKVLPKLKFTKKLQENASQYINSELDVFKNKFYERKNNLKIVQLQYLQRKQELKEIKATANQLEEKLKLEEKQYEAMEGLVKSGAKSKLELIDKEKEVNQIKNDLETTLLSISRTELSIEEAKSLMNEKKQTIKSSVSVELQETIAEIKKIKSRLVTDNDKLEKTTIKSPATGTIKQININTIGAVVQSGVDLIEIVPDSDILFVEAKIDPKDIAFISPDLDVLVKLTAYDFSIYGGLKGSIIEISADSIVDQDSKDGKSFYKVVVKTNKNYLEYNNEKLTIIPGMVASVDIITGKKTIMDFFLKPILKVKQGALHER